MTGRAGQAHDHGRWWADDAGCSTAGSPTAGGAGSGAAADAIAGGRLVVLPTDTVYGLGARRVHLRGGGRRCCAAKGRDRDMPVPVLVGSWSGIDGLMTTVPGSGARRWCAAFWPGGLTLVVQHAPTLAWDLGDAHGTVAVRMPLHPVALELLATHRAAGGVQRQPSAASRRPPPIARGARAARRRRAGLPRRRARPPAAVAVDHRATPRCSPPSAWLRGAAPIEVAGATSVTRPIAYRDSSRQIAVTRRR
ncbi:MAG: Sua5/YciO/YrdC/YwlC family protein [Geodermatophilaceae bacterium]